MNFWPPIGIWRDQVSDHAEHPAAVSAIPLTVDSRIDQLTTVPTAPLGSERYGQHGRILKRLFDVVVSATLLILLLPLLVAIGIVVRSTSPGPALFRQTRVGYREKRFTILKFRTMSVDNDANEHMRYVQSMLRSDSNRRPDASPAHGSEPVFKLVADPRVTNVGKWLRKRSLDELPQLLNVLRGDMSLVGPRPCLEYEVVEYLPHHRLRAHSMPGMTGLWQVGGRSDLHMKEALDLDHVYVSTCSTRMDAEILLRTLSVVVRGTGV